MQNFKLASHMKVCAHLSHLYFFCAPSPCAANRVLKNTPSCVKTVSLDILVEHNLDFNGI